MPSRPQLDSPAWLHRHDLTPDDGVRMIALRQQVAGTKGMLRGIEARPAFDALSKRVPTPDGVSFREETIGGVPGIRCIPRDAHSKTILVHFHGGWFTWGTPSGFRNLVGHIALHSGCAAFIPDYRLAPENPFPAAIDDALACVAALRDRAANGIAISGDSAGGNLALLLSSRQKLGLVGVVALSPVTDLALGGASWETKADADPYFTRAQVQSLVDGYLAGHDPKGPAASPLYGALNTLPPLQIHVGTEEVLLNDAEDFALAADAAGGDVQLHVWEGMPHGFLSGVGRFDAAGEGLSLIGEFLAARSRPGIAAPNRSPLNQQSEPTDSNAKVVE